MDSDRNQLIEEIGRSFNGGQFGGIYAQIVQPELRRNVMAALCDKFGIPNRVDLSDRAFSVILMACRLKEDAFGVKDKRDEARGFLVGLLADAILMERGGVVAEMPASPSVAELAPAYLPEPMSPAAAEPEPKAAAAVAEAAPQETPVSKSHISLVQGGEITIPLFKNGKPPRPHPPADLISFLMPGPGPDAQGRALSRWLSAIPATADSYAVGCGLLDGIGGDRLAEMEAELLSAPRIVLERFGQHGVVQPSQPMFNGALPSEVLNSVNSTWGNEVAEDETDAAIELFRASLADTIQQFWPEKAEALHTQGAVLRIGSALRRTLTVCAAVERIWLDELNGDTEGDPQIVLGNFRPNGQMDAGMIFRRAAFLTYGVGFQMNDALADAIMDLRHAQVCRYHALDAIGPEYANYDNAFLEDCSRPLNGYMIQEEEAEPAF